MASGTEKIFPALAWTFSLFVSLSLCVDSQARCSAGDSVGHFWSDRYELWGCVSAEAEKEGAA